MVKAKSNNPDSQLHDTVDNPPSFYAIAILSLTHMCRGRQLTGYDVRHIYIYNHTETSAPDSTLEWSSLKLAPILASGIVTIAL